MRTYVYIDGFNLYYGAIKNTPYRWLNLWEFCCQSLPQNQVLAVKYFTARVKGRPTDPTQPARQELFFRALRTTPGVSIILGHFLSNPVRMPLANPPANGPATALVLKTEEKGSDVNIASHLINDGWKNLYDTVP